MQIAAFVKEPGFLRPTSYILMQMMLSILHTLNTVEIIRSALLDQTKIHLA